MSVSVNGKAVPETDYERTDKKLVISNLPQGKFDLEIVVTIKPQVTQASALMHSCSCSAWCIARIPTFPCCLSALLRR